MSKREGFTLIELLVVISIIALLEKAGEKRCMSIESETVGLDLFNVHERQ